MQIFFANFLRTFFHIRLHALTLACLVSPSGRHSEMNVSRTNLVRADNPDASSVNTRPKSVF